MADIVLIFVIGFIFGLIFLRLKFYPDRHPNADLLIKAYQMISTDPTTEEENPCNHRL